jgi:hypothetical protein
MLSRYENGYRDQQTLPLAVYEALRAELAMHAARQAA